MGPKSNKQRNCKIKKSLKGTVDKIERQKLDRKFMLVSDNN